MKKLFFFATALFAAVSFSACSDDDKDDNKDASIVGTWQITREVSYEIVPGEGKFDKDITYPIDDVNDDYGFYYTYTFNEDGSGTYKSFNYYENNQLQEEWPLKYSISNNVLTIPQEYEYNGTFKIEQLTKTQLVLFEEIDDDGYKAAITYTFKRI